MLITPPDAPDPALPTTPAGRYLIGNSTNKVKNDLNHDQPHHSRDGKQGRQTSSDHRGPSTTPCFLKQILRTPCSDTHFMADLRLSSWVPSQSAMEHKQSQAITWGSDPDQSVKTARRKLINRQGRKVARECLMKIHSASKDISVATTTEQVRY